MKKFEIRNKRSPVAGKKQTADANRLNVDTDDAVSDYTDSESGAPTDTDVIDGTRSATPDPIKTKEALESLRIKIEKIKDEIKKEQTTKKEQVKEYLDLSEKAASDEAKLKNIRLVFEKNNQASTQALAKLQRKLERYLNEAKKIEHHGASSHRAAKEVLKDMGQGLKDFGGSVVGNIKTATDALVSKPKDTVNKNKSGSADNITSLARGEGQSIFYDGFLDNPDANKESRLLADGTSPTSPTGSTTLPANFKISFHNGSDNGGPFGPETNSPSEASYHAKDSPQNSSLSRDCHPITSGNEEASSLMAQLSRNSNNIDDLAGLIQMLQSDLSEMREELISQATGSEERANERYDRLEEHLNDFVELTQNELSNMKQEISNMEEKMNYQLDERTRDLQEALENANTRITKMEVQNQHQQLITMEVDNPNAKMLLTKCINVVLAFLAVILVFVSTISTIIGPFLNARWKVVSMVVLIFAIVFTASRWELIAETIEKSIFHSRTVH